MNFISIISLCTVITAQLITVDTSTICQCTQLFDQDSCNTLGVICSWSNNQCISSQCSQIVSDNCQMLPNCYFNNESCLDFKDCQTLNGNSISSCYSQNIQCSWVSGTNCTPVSQMNCSQIYQEAYCTNAGNSLCIWDNAVCSEMTECSQQLTETSCIGTGSTCFWNPGTNQCLQNYCVIESGDTCVTESQCYPILVNPSNFNKYQICIVQDCQCINGGLSDLTQDYCFTKSFYTAYWNNISGQCEACSSINYDQLLGYVTGIMIIFIVL